MLSSRDKFILSRDLAEGLGYFVQLVFEGQMGSFQARFEKPPINTKGTDNERGGDFEYDPTAAVESVEKRRLWRKPTAEDQEADKMTDDRLRNSKSPNAISGEGGLLGRLTKKLPKNAEVRNRLPDRHTSTKKDEFQPSFKTVTLENNARKEAKRARPRFLQKLAYAIDLTTKRYYERIAESLA